MSAVFGDSAPVGGDVISGGGSGDLPTEQEQQPLATGAEEQSSTPPAVESEVDVTKLDLSQPQHIQTFRNSYEKVKYEREQERERADRATQELETFRASQGKGVFLDTNLPLEDFKPREALTRMMEEEPEYYEAVAADFMETHFWSDLAPQINSIEGRPLNPNDPADAEKLESLGMVWDSLARRMSKGHLDGESLYSVLEILEQSPDLQQVVLARMNGASASLPAQQPGMPPQPQSAWGQPHGVESAEVIAQRYGLDPSDQAHAQLIDQMRRDQQTRLTEQTQRQRELQQRDVQIQAMQRQVDELKNSQEGLRNMSTGEAERRAAARLTELLDSSLDADIQKTYGTAVPQDKRGLLTDLRTIARAALDSNPDYKAATSRAEKWFKQAASARDPKDRDRWDKAGLDALAVVSNYRAAAITAAGERLLGPIRRTTARQEQRTRELQRGRRELPGGQVVPPITPRQPAAVGDMQATRDAVRQRLRDAQASGIPGLPRT